MSACVLEEAVRVYLELDDTGSWQLTPANGDNFPLDGYPDGVTCTIHGNRIPPPRKCRIADPEQHIPPLPTLTELHELIGETLRQQGFARVQAVIDGGDPT